MYLQELSKPVMRIAKLKEKGCFRGYLVCVLKQRSKKSSGVAVLYSGIYNLFDFKR